MITSIHQLYNLAQSPKINEISLSLLCDFYDSYLNPYTFQYRVLDTSGDKPITFTVNLKFDKENFCHLLAIEKIVQRVKNSTELKQFKSLDGWNNVKNGTITIPSLRQKPTKKVFNNNKDKYVFFYILPKLLDNPKGVLFDKSKVIGTPTNIDCEIVFHDQFNDAMVHLGIKRDEKLGYYIPKSFFVERITQNKNGLRFVGDQQQVTVTKI